MISSASMSLDGFIAYDDHTPGALFDWYDAGEIEVPNAGDLPAFHLTPPSAQYWNAWRAQLGCLVVGRTLFDVTDGWKGTHPLGVPVVVVTHEAPTGWSYPGAEDFRFVTTGIVDAIATAREIAGAADVGIAAGTVAAQALEAGLLDAVGIDLVPVVLGSGRRYFGDRPLDTAVLGDPETVIAAPRVTHLLFPVPR